MDNDVRAKDIPEQEILAPDYKNWVPLQMIGGLGAGTAALALGAAAAGSGRPSIRRRLLQGILGLGALGCGLGTVWLAYMHDQFSYNGDRQLAAEIVDGLVERIQVPEGGRILDVGCGSGALTIAAAKKNPKAEVIGIDRWGKEYAPYSMELCQENAKAEGVTNVSFQKGDARTLPYADGTFDAVTSNYVYHNIMGADRQECLLETLRVLKKGGTFVLHDVMSESRYGDMNAFVERLKAMGYEKVELIDTTDGFFMDPDEAFVLALADSTLLTGTK